MDDYWGSLPRDGWQDEAACVHFDQRMWFDGDNSMAKQICAHCPVSDDCLAFILDLEPNALQYRHGVFGGMTPEERQSFYRALLDAVA